MSRRTQFRLLVALTIVWATWAGWSLLGRATPYELRVLDDLGAPIASAVADIDGDQVGTSGSDGRIRMDWNRSSVVLEVSAPGHVAQMLTLAEPPEGVVDVVLKARVLRGRVVTPDGVAVDDARIMTNPTSGLTDGEGNFNIRGAEPGAIAVEKPAWLATTFNWDGGPGEVLVELEPFAARAVIAVGIIAPFGVALGMAMPIGLRRLEKLAPEAVPYAWGVNGIASVVASVLGIAVAIRLGFPAASLLACGCYAAALVQASRGEWPSNG